MQLTAINDQKKTKVLLLFGGESPEHKVSVVSAGNVFKAIDKKQFDVTLGFIDRRGEWWLVSKVTGSRPPESEQLRPLLGGRSFTTISGDEVIPDVLFPVLHGKNGEDGSVQALGQLLHIPVVGCDMTASAICMDKVTTKEVLYANGIPTVPYRTHRVGESVSSYKALIKELGGLIFVKPARAGSSVGVSKVVSEDQFASALRLAHQYDEVVLIEKAITGRELEVAAFGNPPRHIVSGVGEIIAGDEFYSYSAKYSPDSASEVVIPADLDGEVTEQIRSLAFRTYSVLGCRGMARIDFFLDKQRNIYVNEVNTIPGFTDISMYPKLWQQEGVSYSELITRLIRAALDGTM